MLLEVGDSIIGSTRYGRRLVVISRITEKQAFCDDGIKFRREYKDDMSVTQIGIGSDTYNMTHWKKANEYDVIQFKYDAKIRNMRRHIMNESVVNSLPRDVIERVYAIMTGK